MAKCFPDTPDDLPPMICAVGHLWQLIKHLPENWKAWIRLQPQNGLHEFLLLQDEDNPIYLAHVSTEENIAKAVDYLRSIQQDYGCPVALLSKSLAAGGLFSKTPDGLPFWGASELNRPERFLQTIVPHLRQIKDSAIVQRLRALIAPEVIVPAQNIARHSFDDGVKPTTDLTEYALDYHQEDVLKKDLLLTPEGQDAVTALRARVITGVAGSGKSLVLIHRAKLLTELNPDCKCIVLTYNHVLCDDLKSRFFRLNRKNTTILGWKTFAKWCLDELKLLGVSIRTRADVIPNYKRNEIIGKIHRKFLGDTGISESMLRDEFNWIKDNLTFSEDDYLRADRQGRGFGLTEAQRKIIFSALRDYTECLQQSAYKYDWFDIPWELWSKIEQGHEITQYDVILIDEAQFFPPIAFELIRRALKPGGHIFLSADPTQGFLKRRLSWLSMGIDIRGRSHRLRQCYRTTRHILEFARAFYRSRLGEDEQEIDLSDEQSLARMAPGKPPILEAVDARQTEHAYVVNEIKTMLAKGIKANDILLLHADSQRVNGIAEALFDHRVRVPVCNFKRRDYFTGREVRVCTLEAATGLEAPIVFVLGAGSILEQEERVELTSEEKAEIVRDNTRKLYMAFTRAATRLIITLPKVYAGKGYFRTDKSSKALVAENRITAN